MVELLIETVIDVVVVEIEPALCTTLATYAFVSGAKFATGASVPNNSATDPEVPALAVWFNPVVSKLKYKSFGPLSTYLFTASSVTSKLFEAFVNVPDASPPNLPSVEIPLTVIDESANPKLVASIVPIVAVPDIPASVVVTVVPNIVANRRAEEPKLYVLFAVGIIARLFTVPVSVPPVSNKFKLAEPVIFPTTAPVNAPVNAVAVIVPFTSNAVDGVVVPIPTLDSEPSKVINVEVVPPSLTLKVISVFEIVFEIIAPVLSTVIDKSESAPTVIPESVTLPSVHDVVSFAFDLRYFADDIPPNASETVDVP